MVQKVKDLGHKSGKMLIFGGVYSNLQALEAVIQLADEHNIAPENCICTGDIIGYCGQPQETLDSFKNWGAYSILGNVEIQLRDGQEDCGCDFTAGSRCDGFSEIWYAFAKANLSSSSKQYFNTLPDHITFQYAGRNIGVVHGSADQVSQFIFKSSDWAEKIESYQDLVVDTIIAGHCGLPFKDRYENLLWLNPGVIGMPANDGTTNTWAMILDDTNGFKATHIPVIYDHQTAIHHMRKNHLPKEYAVTLETGIWDNMEILPQQERLLQGKSLDL
ncbi:metallophosphoesterase family protein [Nonlabens sp.]|uniref:metallophosphoesterase family protein n=1 Tax=Nonlabens sp. TaxID=1888209 RepID=UPI003F6A0365